MTGIVCIDKPQEMTSFACCAVFRRLLGEKKIGHAGTLDPMATGVLPLMVGKATRALDFLPCHDKEYVATLRFGCVSDTLDVWGQVTPTGKPLPSRCEVEALLPAFRGEIRQVPPMLSALKQDGVRLYELARKGVEVEREARPVTVYALTLLRYDPEAGEATLRCACSKGTYIRTLCDDLGRAAGCGAVMTSLRRTQAAGFGLDRCISLDEARELAASGALEARLLPVDQVFSPYPSLTVTAAQATRFANGGRLDLTRLKAPVTGLTRVYHPNGTFLGLGQPENGELAIGKLF